MDLADGEECCELLDTTSMDEDYRMLQSDLLCFYQSGDDDPGTVRERRLPKGVATANEATGAAGAVATAADAVCDSNQSDVEKIRHRQRDQKQMLTNGAASSICVVPINYEDDDDEDSTASTATTSTVAAGAATAAVDHPPSGSTTEPAPPTKASGAEPTATAAHVKNEVLFKTLFGATKNAIYRTAQSIIDNHEKKSLAKTHRAAVDAADAALKSPTECSRKKDFFNLKPCSSGRSKATAASTPETPTPTAESVTVDGAAMESAATSGGVVTATAAANIASGATPRGSVAKSLSAFSLGGLRGAHSDKGRVPGVVRCVVVRPPESADTEAAAGGATLPLGGAADKGSNGLLRLFESPVFNIHFALHYLFYSKEPGVLSFIGNKIFSFRDHDVDLYMPQLILMYMQMDELAEVLDPYLVYRCRRTVDFALKCSWLLEAYNFNAATAEAATGGGGGRKSQLALMRELYPKRERRELRNAHSCRLPAAPAIWSPAKKTHHRSQSDATGLLSGAAAATAAGAIGGMASGGGVGGGATTMGRLYQTPVRLCLGDLSTGRAFDSGCGCFETVRGAVNGLLGQQTVCTCGVSFAMPHNQNTNNITIRFCRPPRSRLKKSL